jgi:hypothetical protein
LARLAFVLVPPGPGQRRIWDDQMSMETPDADKTLAWLETRSRSAPTPNDLLGPFEEFLIDNDRRVGTKQFGLAGAAAAIIATFNPPEGASDHLKRDYDDKRLIALDRLRRHGLPWDKLQRVQRETLQLRFFELPEALGASGQPPSLA